MTDFFWVGFEKRAYDYAEEVKDREGFHSYNSKRTPKSKLKEGLIGAGMGAIMGGSLAPLDLAGAMGGALSDRISNTLRLARIGLAIGGGAAIGGFMGVAAAISNKLGIEESKRIMRMEPAARKTYLQSLARKNEISEREAHDWNRDAEKERNDERRHRESMGQRY